MASKHHWVRARSLLYIIFIQMFFSLHSKTCNIFFSGRVFVRRGFCPTENRRGFCPGGFCPGGLLSWTPHFYTVVNMNPRLVQNYLRIIIRHVLWSSGHLYSKVLG